MSTSRGQKVTLDTNTGHYWYWSLPDSGSKTYAEQMEAIAGLGTYGNIAGGRHTATESEMLALWGFDIPGVPLGYEASESAANFDPTWPPIPVQGADIVWWGRYEFAFSPGDDFHFTLSLWVDSSGTGEPMKDLWPGTPLPDGDSFVGAWVTTDAPGVPVRSWAPSFGRRWACCPPRWVSTDGAASIMFPSSGQSIIGCAPIIILRRKEVLVLGNPISPES